MSDSCLPVPAVPQGAAADPPHKHEYDSTGHCKSCGAPRCPTCGRSEEEHDGSELHGCVVFWGDEPVESWHPRNERAVAALRAAAEPTREEATSADALIEAVRRACDHYADAVAEESETFAANPHELRHAREKAYVKFTESLAALRQSLASAEARAGSLRKAASIALHMVDTAMGDTDPQDPEHPLLVACQWLSAALSPSPSEPAR